jgi:hypothetical protein
MGIFDQMKLYPFEMTITGIVFSGIIAGIYCMLVGNVVGIITCMIFLFCGLILGDSLFQMMKLNWIMKLMFISWVCCIFVTVTEIMGIWPILVNFFGG